LDDGPSRTALAAAFHRADHQRLEGGVIFKDGLAIQMVEGQDRDRSLLQDQEKHRLHARTMVDH
jgi:O-methyltransferase involved in polyketide biosynthesis